MRGAGSAFGGPTLSSVAVSCAAAAATHVCTSLPLRGLLHTELQNVRLSAGNEAAGAAGLVQKWGMSRCSGCLLHADVPLRLSRRNKPPPLTAI